MSRLSHHLEILFIASNWALISIVGPICAWVPPIFGIQSPFAASVLVNSLAHYHDSFFERTQQSSGWNIFVVLVLYRTGRLLKPSCWQGSWNSTSIFGARPGRPEVARGAYSRANTDFAIRPGKVAREVEDYHGWIVVLEEADLNEVVDAILASTREILDRFHLQALDNHCCEALREICSSIYSSNERSQVSSIWSLMRRLFPLLRVLDIIIDTPPAPSLQDTVRTHSLSVEQMDTLTTAFQMVQRLVQIEDVDRKIDYVYSRHWGKAVEKMFGTLAADLHSVQLSQWRRSVNSDVADDSLSESLISPMERVQLEQACWTSLLRVEGEFPADIARDAALMVNVGQFLDHLQCDEASEVDDTFVYYGNLNCMVYRIFDTEKPCYHITNSLEEIEAAGKVKDVLFKRRQQFIIIGAVESSDAYKQVARLHPSGYLKEVGRKNVAATWHSATNRVGSAVKNFLSTAYNPLWVHNLQLLEDKEYVIIRGVKGKACELNGVRVVPTNLWKTFKVLLESADVEFKESAPDISAYYPKQFSEFREKEGPETTRGKDWLDLWLQWLFWRADLIVCTDWNDWCLNGIRVFRLTSRWHETGLNCWTLLADNDEQFKAAVPTERLGCNSSAPSSCNGTATFLNIETYGKLKNALRLTSARHANAGSECDGPALHGTFNDLSFCFRGSRGEVVDHLDYSQERKKIGITLSVQPKWLGAVCARKSAYIEGTGDSESRSVPGALRH